MHPIPSVSQSPGQRPVTVPQIGGLLESGRPGVLADAFNERVKQESWIVLDAAAHLIDHCRIGIRSHRAVAGAHGNPEL